MELLTVCFTSKPRAHKEHAPCSVSVFTIRPSRADFTCTPSIISVSPSCVSRTVNQSEKNNSAETIVFFSTLDVLLFPENGKWSLWCQMMKVKRWWWLSKAKFSDWHLRITSINILLAKQTSRQECKFVSQIQIKQSCRAKLKFTKISTFDTKMTITCTLVSKYDKTW